MLSAGLRLVLAVAAPLLGAAVVHELRRRRRAATVAAVLAIATCAVLVLSIASGVSGGGSLERSFGSAIPGVDLTARADSASVAAILVACLAAMVAVPRHRHDGGRLAGLLLCLGGTATVVAAGNLVLVAGGVEVIAGGTLLLRGQRGPGSRSAAVLAGLLGAGGLALLAAATQLVTAAGSSDLAFVPQGAVGGALAVPWALGGAALLLSPALPGEGASPARDWASVGALPAGFLVLLRLQETAGGQLPGNATIALATVGVAVACLGAYTARRGVSLAAAGRSAVAVLTGVLVSLFGGPLATSGTLLAGLFLAIELALMAAPSWNRQPTAWSAATVALAALPGGAAFAVVAVGLGTVADRGVAAFPELLVLSAVVGAAAVAATRAVAAPRRGWRPVLPGAFAGNGGRVRGWPLSRPGTAAVRRSTRRRRGGGRPRRGCPRSARRRLRCRVLRGRRSGPADRSCRRSGARRRRAHRRGPPAGTAAPDAAAAAPAEDSPANRARSPPGRRRGPRPRPLARGPAADRPRRGRRGCRCGLVPLMETNEPLLAAAAFFAAVVVTVVDGRRAVAVASIAASLGLAPSVASLYGAQAALVLLAAGAAAAVLGSVSRALAERLGRVAGVDPSVPVVGGSDGLFGPRSVRVVIAVLVLPGASWVSFNIPLGSASTVSGVLFPAALIWGCAGMRLLTARTLGDIAVGVAVIGIAAAAAWFICAGVDTMVTAAAAAALAPGAAVITGWLRGRRSAPPVIAASA